MSDTSQSVHDQVAVCVCEGRAQHELWLVIDVDDQRIAVDSTAGVTLSEPRGDELPAWLRDVVTVRLRDALTVDGVPLRSLGRAAMIELGGALRLAVRGC